MDRLGFLQSLAGFSVATVTGTPAPSPSPSSDSWDLCTVGSLPYDKPLALKMRVLDGPDFDLLKYRGQPVMLNIFASWCPPCNEEMPLVVQAATKYAGKNLAIIGIDVDESDNTVRAFRKKFSIPFPIAMDERGGFAYALENGKASNQVTFPNTLFIRPDGYLYCFVNEMMTKDEFAYRTEAFLKDCNALRQAI